MLKINIRNREENVQGLFDLCSKNSFASANERVREKLKIYSKSQINRELDYEKKHYMPISLEKIRYEILINSVQSYYSDFGFNNSDVIYLSNSILNTFFQIDFYDSPIGSEQNLVYSSRARAQLLNGLQEASSQPVVFVSSSPIISFNDISPASLFSIEYFKSPPLATFPKPLYARFFLLNAKTGDRIALSPESPTTNENPFYFHVIINGGSGWSVPVQDKNYSIAGKELTIKLEAKI